MIILNPAVATDFTVMYYPTLGTATLIGKVPVQPYVDKVLSIVEPVPGMKDFVVRLNA